MKTLSCFLVPLAVASALATSAFAAPETYVIDPAGYGHTFPSFSWNHLGYSVQGARFDKTSGTVVLDKEARTGSVEVVIDTTSVSSGSAMFNGHLQGDDFFATGKFPTASFKSTNVRFNGDVPAAVEGVLTIKGISKPVTLTVTHFKAAPHPMAKKDAIGANATAVIKRSDFDLAKYVPYVSDEVNLSIAIEALKQ